MPHEENPARPDGARPTPFRSTARALTLALATLTTGLMAGLFFAYAVSVNPGLAKQSDASYVATENAITEEIGNPLFFAGFLGAVVFLLAALVAHGSRRHRSGRFWPIAVASILYIGGGFVLTMVVNAPMSYRLAAVNPEAQARILAEARNAYEDTWNFWHGVRTLFSTLAFVALICACLLRDNPASRHEDRAQ